MLIGVQDHNNILMLIGVQDHNIEEVAREKVEDFGMVTRPFSSQCLKALHRTRDLDPAFSAQMDPWSLHSVNY